METQLCRRIPAQNTQAAFQVESPGRLIVAANEQIRSWVGEREDVVVRFLRTDFNGFG